jgi:hypothetical protein
MKRYSLRPVLVLLALATVLGIMVTGCTSAKPAMPPFTTTPAAPSVQPPTTPASPASPTSMQQTAPPANMKLPAVNYFSTTNDTIPPNTVIILVWSVSGADSINIDNGIGKVDAQGRLLLIPASSTTYVLTATNTGGSVTSQTEVEVSNLQAASPHYRAGYKISHTGLTCVIGSPLTIKLDTRTADDSEWIIDYYDKTMFTYVDGKYVPQNPLTRGIDGQQQFTFMPIKTGDTRILASYVNHQTPTKFDSIVYDIRTRN